MDLHTLKLPLLRLIGVAGILSIALSVPAGATTIADCNTSLTICSIPPNVFLQLPFTAISGDAVLIESNGTTVGDVFRIFDNVINTGSGTGLGNLAELYGADNVALPTIFSANAVFLPADPSGVTSYTSGGKTYLLGVPEPESLALLSVAAGVLLLLGRGRATTSGGSL